MPRLLNRTATMWQPQIGNETRRLLAHLNLPVDGQHNLLNETTSILTKCCNPQDEGGSNIGLVFGYVQSGKTMSFTTLTALAKDNGYRIIIVIAGISTNLVAQSYTRLERDLQIDSRSDLQWLSLRNPRRNDSTTREQIAGVISEYRDETFPEEDLKTILITVMKQRNHLPNLTELLSSLDLRGIPTLIIDDEGDQHSLNTKERRNARTGVNETSAIHRRILELRGALPHHTFIQYTATPQALLFIDIYNSLSPNFIQLLTPGTGYAGGSTFFQDNPLLTNDIDDINPDEDPFEPPTSLVYAMQIFFLGVVKGSPNKEGNKRSMMIHPSQLTYTHGDYYRFATSIKRHFVEVLSLPDQDPDKVDLLATFRPAYDDLARTASDLPPFEELTGHRLRHAINRTVIQSLNSQGSNRTIVDWRNNYSYILIGGQAMDRGFTVEGLTVTYMPRSIGVGNADTIQQRARFFGYKQRYIGYCRVYLDEDARNAFVRYVNHEEDMRRRLVDLQQSGQQLNQWYREVFLPANLNLSRQSVFRNHFDRSIFKGEWFYTKVPHQNHHSITSNALATQTFIDTNNWSTSSSYPSTDISLATVFDNLLSQLQYSNTADAGNYTALLYTLSRHLEENPDELCTVFKMSDLTEQRVRTLNVNGHINQLFQGRNNRSEGDRAEIGAGITVQIHSLTVQDNLKQPLHTGVVAIACFIPSGIGEELIRWADD
jgi:hypothetical protein